MICLCVLASCSFTQFSKKTPQKIVNSDDVLFITPKNNEKKVIKPEDVFQKNVLLEGSSSTFIFEGNTFDLTSLEVNDDSIEVQINLTGEKQFSVGTLLTKVPFNIIECNELHVKNRLSCTMEFYQNLPSSILLVEPSEIMLEIKSLQQITLTNTLLYIYHSNGKNYRLKYSIAKYEITVQETAYPWILECAEGVTFSTTPNIILKGNQTVFINSAWSRATSPQDAKQIGSIVASESILFLEDLNTRLEQFFTGTDLLKFSSETLDGFYCLVPYDSSKISGCPYNIQLYYDPNEEYKHYFNTNEGRLTLLVHDSNFRPFKLSQQFINTNVEILSQDSQMVVQMKSVNHIPPSLSISRVTIEISLYNDVTIKELDVKPYSILKINNPVSDAKLNIPNCKIMGNVVLEKPKNFLYNTMITSCSALMQTNFLIDNALPEAVVTIVDNSDHFAREIAFDLDYFNIDNVTIPLAFEKVFVDLIPPSNNYEYLFKLAQQSKQLIKFPSIKLSGSNIPLINFKGEFPDVSDPLCQITATKVNFISANNKIPGYFNINSESTSCPLTKYCIVDEYQLANDCMQCSQLYRSNDMDSIKPSAKSVDLMIVSSSVDSIKMSDLNVQSISIQSLDTSIQRTLNFENEAPTLITLKNIKALLSSKSTITLSSIEAIDSIVDASCEFSIQTSVTGDLISISNLVKKASPQNKFSIILNDNSNMLINSLIWKQEGLDIIYNGNNEMMIPFLKTKNLQIDTVSSNLKMNYMALPYTIMSFSTIINCLSKSTALTFCCGFSNHRAAFPSGVSNMIKFSGTHTYISEYYTVPSDFFDISLESSTQVNRNGYYCFYRTDYTQCPRNYITLIYKKGVPITNLIPAEDGFTYIFITQSSKTIMPILSSDLTKGRSISVSGAIQSKLNEAPRIKLETGDAINNLEIIDVLIESEHPLSVKNLHLEGTSYIETPSLSVETNILLDPQSLHCLDNLTTKVPCSIRALNTLWKITLGTKTIELNANNTISYISKDKVESICFDVMGIDSEWEGLVIGLNSSESEIEYVPDFSFATSASHKIYFDSSFNKSVTTNKKGKISVSGDKSLHISSLSDSWPSNLFEVERDVNIQHEITSSFKFCIESFNEKRCPASSRRIEFKEGIIIPSTQLETNSDFVEITIMSDYVPTIPLSPFVNINTTIKSNIKVDVIVSLDGKAISNMTFENLNIKYTGKSTQIKNLKIINTDIRILSSSSFCMFLAKDVTIDVASLYVLSNIAEASNRKLTLITEDIKEILVLDTSIAAVRENGEIIVLSQEDYIAVTIETASKEVLLDYAAEKEKISFFPSVLLTSANAILTFGIGWHTKRFPDHGKDYVISKSSSTIADVHSLSHEWPNDIYMIDFVCTVQTKTEGVYCLYLKSSENCPNDATNIKYSSDMIYDESILEPSEKNDVLEVIIADSSEIDQLSIYSTLLNHKSSFSSPSKGYLNILDVGQNNGSASFSLLNITLNGNYTFNSLTASNLVIKGNYLINVTNKLTFGSVDDAIQMFDFIKCESIDLSVQIAPYSEMDVRKGFLSFAMPNGINRHYYDIKRFRSLYIGITIKSFEILSSHSDEIEILPEIEALSDMVITFNPNIYLSKMNSTVSRGRISQGKHSITLKGELFAPPKYFIVPQQSSTCSWDFAKLPIDPEPTPSPDNFDGMELLTDKNIVRTALFVAIALDLIVIIILASYLVYAYLRIKIPNADDSFDFTSQSGFSIGAFENLSNI